MSEEEPEFAKDMLRGAEAIAEFLYGDAKLRRAVYHLTATSNFPTFKLGSMICARKSVILKWIAAQETRYANDNHAPTADAVRSRNVSHLHNIEIDARATKKR